MNDPKLYILCVEDEMDVLDAILRDLSPFESTFQLEGFSSAQEAGAWIDGLDPDADRIALIYCDHVMPGQRGVDFMSELQRRESVVLKGTCKVLFTGQAGHQETITAINEAGICHYQAKPWEPDELVELTRKLLTDFVIAEAIPPLPYMSQLDQKRIAEHLHENNPFQDA
ncbi:MAG: response regulator [Opitutales bacterium]|nr:response regulator [Opitutales bacterium]